MEGGREERKGRLGGCTMRRQEAGEESTLSAHASLSAAEHKADSMHEENIGGVNFKPQI